MEIKKIENTTEETQMEPVQEETAQAESASEAVCETAETAPEAEQTEKTTKGRFRRSRLFALLVALCVLATISAGTMAYFRVEDTSYNVITTGGVEIELVETQVDEDGNVSEFPGKVEGVMPGQKVSKIVSIKNTGTEANGKDHPVFARMKLDVQIVDEKNDATTLDVENVVLEIDTANWLTRDPDDGYYYYARALGPGEITEPLLKNVTLKPHVGNEYMNATITIGVQAEAVQAENNDEGGVLGAAGWPEVNP